jgi:hypothetical protein
LKRNASSRPMAATAGAYQQHNEASVLLGREQANSKEKEKPRLDGSAAAPAQQPPSLAPPLQLPQTTQCTAGVVSPTASQAAAEIAAIMSIDVNSLVDGDDSDSENELSTKPPEQLVLEDRPGRPCSPSLSRQLISQRQQAPSVQTAKAVQGLGQSTDPLLEQTPVGEPQSLLRPGLSVNSAQPPLDFARQASSLSSSSPATIACAKASIAYHVGLSTPFATPLSAAGKVSKAFHPSLSANFPQPSRADATPATPAAATTATPALQWPSFPTAPPLARSLSTTPSSAAAPLTPATTSEAVATTTNSHVGSGGSGGGGGGGAAPISTTARTLRVAAPLAPKISIIIDSAKVSGISALIGRLRGAAHVRVMVAPLRAGSFLLSPRAIAERLLQSEMSDLLKNDKLLAKLRELVQLYPRVYVIVERDREKQMSFSRKSTEGTLEGIYSKWSRQESYRVAFVELVRMKALVLHSTGQDDTAGILGGLLRSESQKGHRIDSTWPDSLTPDQE